MGASIKQACLDIYLTLDQSIYHLTLEILWKVGNRASLIDI